MEKQQQVWGSHLEQAPMEQNVLFCAGRDVKSLPMADEVLLPFDIWTNRAHSIMLYEQGLIPSQSISGILKGLAKLEKAVAEGKFFLDPNKEDVHINVEAFVTETEGAEAGGRMHIGRSRNDQSACDMRLYLRAAGLQLFYSVRDLANTLLQHAHDHVESVMPGFTHYQPAMITTWGHWVCSYAQGLCRDLERLALAISQVNRNPLGAAAAFGTSWPLDRQLTTELLAFDRVDTNTLDCIVSRWENEAQLAHSGAMLMNHLSIMAQDLIFLSHPYSGMLQVDDAYVTGSSIMPQKKNPDFAEVIKSKASLAHGFLNSLMGIQKGGLSGYNRDTQATKYLIMDLIRECDSAPIILKGVFSTLQVNQENMHQKCNVGFMNSVDIADHLARSLHLPFRECYHILAQAVRLSEPETKITIAAMKKALSDSGHPVEIAEDLHELHDAKKLLDLRAHQGSPSIQQCRAQIEQLTLELSEISTPLEGLQKRIQNASERCQNYEVSK